MAGGSRWLTNEQTDERMQTLDPNGSCHDAIEFFYKKAWSDGMPVVPPTVELVDRMMGGTSHNGDEEIGQVPPNFEPLTVRRIAEHAVMAGALPIYMPVIIGAMRAILDEKLNMHGVQTTIHGAAPHDQSTGLMEKRSA